MRIRLKKESEEAQIDMTPMLDVIFILLIFFIVASHFERTEAITIQRPEVSQAEPKPRHKVELFLTADGTILLNNQQQSSETLQAALTALFQPPQAEPLYLLIQADTNSRHGDLIKVMEIAKKAGITQIAIAVDAKQND